MKRALPLFGLVLLIVVMNLAIATNTEANPKIKKCLKSKDCRFIVSGSATQEPKMSFLVVDKVWKTFRDRDKTELREMLKRKIKEANGKPEKYVNISKKAKNYDPMRVNIANMRSYSVFLSYGKTRKGDLQLDEEIMVNY
jgi:hypothetical protein